MMAPALLRPLLRAVAIAIAIAGATDPTISVERAPRPQVTLVTAVTGDGLPIESQVATTLQGEFKVTARRPIGPKLPCAPQQPCVVIADGSIDLDLPWAPHEGVPYGFSSGVPYGPVSVIKVVPGAGPNVELSALVVSVDQHPSAAGSARVELIGSGVAGRTTEVRVLDGSTVVGSAAHEWQSDGTASMAVSWWPIRDGARVLHVEAVPLVGEATAIDNSVEAAVNVRALRLPVLVFEPRPSWASTFVRRALEGDPRFIVRSQARLGPALSAATPSARMDSATLQSAAAVIVSAPEALSAVEVDLLNRYVHVRGGTLVLLPDRMPSGAASRLFPGRWTERLVPVPEAIGPLRATEILRRPDVDSTDVILGSSTGMPAIVVAPTGAGRVIVSGAMDAWRYRDADDGAFDRFWRGIMVEAARQGAELGIELGEGLAAAGSIVPFEVHSRRMHPPLSETVRASLQCDDDAAQVIRLWPQGEPGAYAGDLPAGRASDCRLDVSIADGPSTSAAVAIVRAPTRGVRETLSNLERLVARTGGVSVVSGDEQHVADHLRAQAPAAAIRTAIRPMHSPWWILPFAACLSGEWWLRRRDGLR